MTDPSADGELHDYRATVPRAYIALAWLWVTVPFLYGVFELVLKVRQLFQ
ncbi:MFS transporter small subunit [Mycobacterium sp. WMMD1722]